VARSADESAPGARRLEDDLAAELDLARAVGGVADYAEVGVVDRGVGRAEDGVIERVLRFQAQLEVQAFMQLGERKLLLHRHVGVEGGRRADGSEGAGHVAEGIDGRQLKIWGLAK
jgi:hypothetical protein